MILSHLGLSNALKLDLFLEGSLEMVRSHFRGRKQMRVLLNFTGIITLFRMRFAMIMTVLVYLRIIRLERGIWLNGDSVCQVHHVV